MLDGQVGLVVEDRARPDRRRVQVGGPGHHRRRRARARGRRPPRRGPRRPPSRSGPAGGASRPGPRRAAPGPGRRRGARVGGCRSARPPVIDAWRGGGHPGEPHGQVVDGLQVPAGRAGHVGLRRARGTACGRWGRRPRWRGRRRCAGPSATAPAGRSPPRARRPPAGLCGPPRLSIHMRQSPTGRPSASTGTVLAHCPVHETATTCSRAHRPAATGPPGGVDDHPPPLLGVLDGAAPGQQPGRDRRCGRSRRRRR